MVMEETCIKFVYVCVSVYFDRQDLNIQLGYWLNSLCGLLFTCLMLKLEVCIQETGKGRWM